MLYMENKSGMMVGVSSQFPCTSECKKSGYNKRRIVVSAKPIFLPRLSALTGAVGHS